MSAFQYKAYIDGLYDKYQRVYTRYQAHHRSGTAFTRSGYPGVAIRAHNAMINRMKSSMNEIENELVDLGELKP